MKDKNEVSTGWRGVEDGLCNFITQWDCTTGDKCTHALDEERERRKKREERGKGEEKRTQVSTEERKDTHSHAVDKLNWKASQAELKMKKKNSNDWETQEGTLNSLKRSHTRDKGCSNKGQIENFVLALISFIMWLTGSLEHFFPPSFSLPDICYDKVAVHN